MTEGTETVPEEEARKCTAFKKSQLRRDNG